VISPSHRPLPDNTQHTQHTFMAPAGFKPTIPASERPQTHQHGAQMKSNIPGDNPSVKLPAVARGPSRIAHRLGLDWSNDPENETRTVTSYDTWRSWVEVKLHPILTPTLWRR